MQASLDRRGLADVPGVDLVDEQLTLRREQAIRDHKPSITCSTNFLEFTIDRA